MRQDKKSEKILRYIWAAIPWCIVCFLFIVFMILGIKISRQKQRIKEEKLAAYQKNRPPVNVVTLNVRPTEIVDRINLPAVTAPWEDITIYAEVSGSIISLSAEEGDDVKKGEILAQIDPRDYQSRLKQINVTYELAKLEFERISKLAETSAASQAQLDSIKARLDESSAALSAAKLDLERCTITAPISGFINKRFAKQGVLINRSDPLFQILDTRQVKVEVGIPESDVYAIRNLETADITIEALDNLKVKGEKIFLSRQPESFARVYNLKLKVENKDNLIRPGMFARVDLVKKKYLDSLVVPLYSIITDGQKNYLYVVNNETSHYRPVELGILEGWQVQITRGLEPYDRVIVVGQRNLEDGQKVKVIKTINDPRFLDK